ncbi:HlyD family secretion protein [Pedobacter ginsengisoli]|uniref:HlyD family secretion protein n=1 Tax=Pedobacter ginsengisoli TaxID=363852 RepID=UPI00254F48DD|nr:HlyD family secretion protein [Pedobacter ginsengisoli]
MKTTTTSNVSSANRAYLLIAIAIIATALIYFGIHIAANLDSIQTNDAQVDAYINPVSARAGGFIKKVCFEEHQRVKSGDTLVIMEDQEYQQKLNEANAFMDDAKAQLDVLDAGIHAAESGTLVNRDQIQAARARLVQQQSEIERYRNLIKEEAVTGADLESVQARYDVALSDFHAAQSGLKTGLAKVEELRSRKALLNADLKKKEAQLTLAKINLAYTIIKAPYAGRMGRKTILEGQQIQPGQPLVSIVNEHKKWITANFKETQIEGMRIGQTVDIEIDAISKKTYKGRIQAISASTGAKFSLLPPDNSTGNFVKIVQRIPVRISFDDQNIEEVKSGMNATVSVYYN